MNILLLTIFYLIKSTISINQQFSNPLQRFVYDDPTDTIILASVNHIYSLNASDLSVLSDIDLSSIEKLTHHHQCLNTNKSSLSKNLYHFPISSYLIPSHNNIFNQLLLLVNNSVLICSTSNRGGSCQLRSITNLHPIKNSPQRVVSSSPYYPSVGLINKNTQILYLANTYDPQCDPFYEIPTISGRNLSEENFLSIINLNSGQSALQQSTYTLRLLNIRLIKEFFLYYLYGFTYKTFTYYLTIQQSDLIYHHTHKLKFQTKIIRFCQTLKQPMIKSYIEIPLTCGHNYHYLINAKFSHEKKILYGLFRNTTLANLTSTSHAICAYSIEQIQKGFFQTIKRCLVDGKGFRGLGFISPDTHCIPSKNLNEINDDYCPDENESFFQYPIGGHRAIEQIKPIIELKDKVNFTTIEIGSNENDIFVYVGDDNGTVHTFQTSNINEIYKQHYQSKVIVDLQLINKNTNLIILTDNQIIKQNVSICEQYWTCNECSNIPICYWYSKENICAHENKRIHRINMCTDIEQVMPELLSSDNLNTEIQINLNSPLQNSFDEYMCRFNINETEEYYYTNAIVNTNNNTIKCLSPLLNAMNLSIYNLSLSIYDSKTNLTFAYYNLKLINCSNFRSCVSCTSYSNICLWNHQTLSCISQQNQSFVSTNLSLIKNANQCPLVYLEKSKHYLNYNINNKTFLIHLEQCDQSLNIDSCQLYDQHKRFVLTTLNPTLTRFEQENNFCLLKCFFQQSDLHQISFYRSLDLHLSIQYSNKTTLIIPHTHISLYHCEHLALNCTTCLQLNPSYNCIWCNNQCTYKNSSNQCLNKNNQECLLPIIENIEPMVLPLHGGTLVTIKGKHFNLYHLSINIADIPCQLIEEESSNNKIVCQSGSAGSLIRSGSVHLKFGPYGPQIHSSQRISYIKPQINSITPLTGIQNGGTILTIHGENLTIGNSHISIFIGNRLCQLLSISTVKIECKTRLFPNSMLNKSLPMKILFDRQTKLTYEQFFMVHSNPIVYSFNKYHQYPSFNSGGHQLKIYGNHFSIVQNIQLEFPNQLFISPLFRNDTYLIFLTPSVQQEKQIPIRLYLDNFNKTSSLIYMNDPIIYELEPVLKPYTNRLSIYGRNLTAIGHTKDEIMVHIGCDLCPILHLQSDKIICQPPTYRPEKYSKTKRLCYSSEHPSIIVSIDNIHSHVGFMLYPKKVIILGVITGCLATMLFIVIITLIIVYLKIRYTQRKYFQGGYIYPNSLIPDEIEKEKPYETIDCLIPIRSYIDYLQHCYSSHQFHLDKIIKSHMKQDLIDQFKYLIENNQNFLDYLFKISIQTNNRKILNNLILTQRYNLKELFQYNHDWIYFNICILTSYDMFIINRIHHLFFQFYSQLKSKISSGPIDAIEQNISYYSLNLNAILDDYSVGFKTIQLIIHIDENQSFNLNCLTCDTITQVKQKILDKLNLFNKISLNEYKLYLLTNPSCSSSSSTASSSVPLIRKSMLTQVLFNRTIKYSTTTTINDSYQETNMLLLNDIDHTNEHVNHWKKLNTLQHYGILTDGYELKILLPTTNFYTQIKYTENSLMTQQSSCQYCSLSTFNYLPIPLINNEHKRLEYIHLLNHTYEEIESLFMEKNLHETYRLFETKSLIHSLLIQIIENLFNDILHNETYFNELIKENSKLFHIFYGHFIPFIFSNLNCLFDNIFNEKFMKSSLDIIAMIFQIGCCSQQNEQQCLLCMELWDNDKFDINRKNCTVLFADEIQHVRLYYTNLEKCFKNKNLSSEYSLTHTDIEKKFELDNSIYMSLIEYSCLHADEIVEYLKNQSTDNDVLLIFVDLVQMYRSIERT